MDAAVRFQKEICGGLKEYLRFFQKRVSRVCGRTLGDFQKICFSVSVFTGKRALEEQEKERMRKNQQAERIMDEYGNSILRLAYSYLHNMSDAEEILQETLLKVLKTSPVFENKTHEKAWLMRVAGNLSKNRIEYNRIRITDELKDSLAADEQEDLSFVWEAVKSLPVKYREVIHLFYQEDCTTQQIARILEMKEATVRSRLHRGREMLKKVLKEAYDFA